MDRWSEFAAWEGDGLSREVFFFPSGGTPLYGSLYSATDVSWQFGLVACASWGVEADRSDPLVRSVALAVARLGGAALVFHYPGYGDSYGELESVDFDDLVDAAGAALAEAARRRPGIEWAMAGFMLGAAVACVASGRAATAEPPLLVQPSLRPAGYFRRLAGRGERRSAGAVAGQAVYGYPLPHRMLAVAAELDAAAESAQEALAGATVIRYARTAESEEVEPIPERFERVEVPGRWRFGAKDDPRLAEAVTAWLERRAAESTHG